MAFEILSPIAYAYSDFARARTYCLGMFLVACLFLTLGGIAAHVWHYPEAVNRAGGLITALSLILVLGQFHFERKHKGEEDKVQTQAIRVSHERQYPLQFSQHITETARARAENRVERARHTILASSVALGAFGEVVHAMGDLLLEGLRSAFLG